MSVVFFVGGGGAWFGFCGFAVVGELLFGCVVAFWWLNFGFLV